MEGIFTAGEPCLSPINPVRRFTLADVICASAFQRVAMFDSQSAPNNPAIYKHMICQRVHTEQDAPWTL